MEKIRINNDDVYRIEVNDNGDCIEFNLLDIDLPFKFVKCGEELIKKQELYYEASTKINEEYKDNQAELLNKMHELDTTFCNELRNVFDELLGENACNKIFGSINKIGMFDELFEQLKPHFKKMELKHDKIQEEIINKYKNQKRDVI